jgi:PAS domain S-box-containing protein
LRGRYLPDLVIAADRATMEATLAAADEAEAASCAARVKGAGDREAWLHWSLRAFKREDSEAVDYLVIATDVSQQKQLEQKLANIKRPSFDAYAELQSIYKAAPVGFFSVDRDFRFQRVNPWMAEINGVSAAAHIGHTVREIVPAIADTIEPLWQRVMDTQEPLLGVEIKARGDGENAEQREWLASYFPVIGEDGASCGVCGLVSEITERRRAEAALQETEARLRAVLNIAPIVIWAIDAEGNFTLSDGSGLLSFGLKPGEIVGENLFEYYAAYPKVVEHARRALRGEHVADVAYVDDIAFETRYAPIHNDVGEVTGAIGVALDISERMRIEDALRSSEARFRTTLDQMLEGCTIIDFGYRYAYLNDAVLLHAGRSREELLGRPMAEIFPTIIGTELERAIKLCMEERVPQLLETPFQQHSGETRWFDLTIQPVPEGVFVLSLDVTDRKDAELALRESERQIREMLENIALVAVTLNLDGTLTFVNDFLLELTGYRREQVLGRDWFEIFVPREQQTARRAEYGETIRAASPKQHFVRPILTARGERRVISWSVSILRDASGRPAGVTAIGDDITDRQRLEEQLRHSQKMEAIGQLAGGVAHDFNNILTAILGYAELARETVRDGTLDSEQLESAIEEIERAGQRASGLTRQLLAFSRRQVVTPEVTSLNTIVHNLERMMARLIEERIRLHLRLDPHLHRCRVDAGQFEQVLLNLVVNARDAMPDGGDLRVVTRNVTADQAFADARPGLEVGEYVCLSVCDTGVGMEPEVQERVFEPFFTTKGLGRGTGLGLSTVYGIISQAGGVITVHSEVGQGTCFDIYLSVVTDEVAQPEDAPDPTDAPTGTERILLCEDEAEVRRLTERVLKAGGYQVTSAGSASAATALADEYGVPPDLLLTDVILPDRHGRQLADELQSRWPTMRVLFISGYPSNVIANHGVLEDGVELLEKPFGRHQLLTRIREILDRAPA